MNKRWITIIAVLLTVLMLGTALSGCSEEKAAEDTAAVRSLEDLNGKSIAVLTGSIFDVLAQEKVPGCKIEYANTTTDSALMLETGKTSAYVVDEPIFRILQKEYPDQTVLESLEKAEYAFFFPKNSEKGSKLCGQMNEFLKNCRENGVLNEIDERWFGDDENAKVVDTESLTAENGVLRMAVISEVGVPFIYVKDGKYVGYDVDVAVHFCKEYGYGIEFVDSNAVGTLANVQSGKCDMGASCVAVTEERKESMLFSDPDYMGGIALVVKGVPDISGENISAGDGNPIEEFFVSVWENFEKTFIREGRWKLFMQGIGVTLLITVLSAIFGTALAFVLYIFSRKGNPIINSVMNFLRGLLSKTPVIVILMIFYYVIFKNISLSAIMVSVIGFTLIFASSVHSLITVGVNAIDKGQMEAARAMGYSDWQAFIRHILPQAAVHIFPGYKGAIVSLIKDTAIVGYISGQDLTKIGDIIRSRTYEAFFPIITTAIIYFVLASLLVLIVEKTEILVLPTYRSKEQILKGVKTK